MYPPKTIHVTGAAGFIGFHLSQKLLDNSIHVTGLDNLNDYYDPHLKQARLDRLTLNPAFTHINIDLADRSANCGSCKVKPCFRWRNLLFYQRPVSRV